MLLSVVRATVNSPLQYSHHNYYFTTTYPCPSSSSSSSLLPRSLFPDHHWHFLKSVILSRRSSHFSNSNCRSLTAAAVNASFVEAPLIWVGRLCIFYALLKAGLAGSDANPLVSELGSNEAVGDGESGDLGFSKWLENFRKNPDKEAADRRKLVSKWHPTTKGTLRRNYRVPSKTEGRRLLKAIASLLSDDDHFTDASSHKGCQIRRESAHSESVCCNNVRALFDELPTPHLIVEITAFPAGPLTEKDYLKAEKLERILRSAPNI